MLAVGVTLLGWPVPAEAAQVSLATDLSIEHTPLQCVTPVKMPKVDAKVLPVKNLDRGYVFFRATGTKSFYYVYLDKTATNDLSALLPRPTAETRAIDYYLQALNRQRLQKDTEQYRPKVVPDELACEEAAAEKPASGGKAASGAGKGAVAPVPVPTPKEKQRKDGGLTIGLTVEGQDPVPPGFNKSDIARIILVSGAIVTLAAALQIGSAAGTAAASGAAGTGTATGAASAGAGTTAAGGGGISTGVLIGGGVVLVGAGIAVAASGGGSKSSNATATPTPTPTRTPTPTPTSPPQPTPGTGDISFRLVWNTCADLDLYVTEPSGEQIYWSHPMSSSGGQLDLDSNSSCGTCRSPAIENVFWPIGRAPRGTYTFFARHYSGTGCGAFTGTSPSYTLQVFRGTSIVQTYTGTVAYGTSSQTYSYTY